MKLLGNITSKVGTSFPILKRPTPLITAVAGVTGKSTQFGEFLALGAMKGGKMLMGGGGGRGGGGGGGGLGLRENIGGGIRDRIGGKHERPAEKGESKFEGVGLRQRIVERASGCSCRCGK
jgi:hypothetical protein